MGAKKTDRFELGESIGTEELSHSRGSIVEKTKDAVLRSVACVLFPRQKLINSEALEKAKLPIVILTSHDTPLDAALIFSLVRSLRPSDNVKITAEAAFPGNQRWRGSAFGEDMILVANKEINKPLEKPHPSPFNEAARYSTNVKALRAVKDLMDNNGILIVQASGMPNEYRRPEQNRLVSGISSIVNMALKANPETGIIPVKMRGGTKFWRDIASVEMHEFWENTTVEFGENWGEDLLGKHRGEIAKVLEQKYREFVG